VKGGKERRKREEEGKNATVSLIFWSLVLRRQFFETFSEFKGREFHMSGESYGGR